MFSRLLTIALALLAFSDVAFGRIGNSGPNVFASRPVGHSPEFKARTPKGRSRSLSKHGKPNHVAEKLQPNARAKSVWEELKEFDHFGAWGPEKNHAGLNLEKADPEKKKRPGKLRKLRTEESKSEESEELVVREVRDFHLPFLP
jgi:hypothetical protein